MILLESRDIMPYIDAIVLAVFLVIVIIYSKRFQTYIFGFGMIDVLFRILNVICSYIPLKSIRSIINTYIPESVPGVINNYCSGILEMVLTFIYVIIMMIFLFYIVKLFIKRKKI